MKRIIVLPVILLSVFIMCSVVYGKTSSTLNYGYNSIVNDRVVNIDKEMDYEEYSTGIDRIVYYKDYIFYFNSTKGQIIRNNKDGSNEVMVSNNYGCDYCYYDGKIFYQGEVDDEYYGIYSFDLDTLKIKKYMTFKGMVVLVNQIYNDYIYFTANSIDDVLKMNLNNNKACRINMNTCQSETIDNSSGSKYMLAKGDNIAVINCKNRDANDIDISIYNINNLQIKKNIEFNNESTGSASFVGMYNDDVFVYNYTDNILYRYHNNNWEEVLRFSQFDKTYKTNIYIFEEDYIYFNFYKNISDNETETKVFKYGLDSGKLTEESK